MSASIFAVCFMLLGVLSLAVLNWADNDEMGVKK